MTRTQLNTAIDSLIRHAEHELEMAKGYVHRDQQSSWIIHMAASRIFQALADTLISVRQAEEQENPRDKETTQTAH